KLIHLGCHSALGPGGRLAILRRLDQFLLLTKSANIFSTGVGGWFLRDSTHTYDSDGIDPGLAVLVLLLRFHGVPVDPDQIRHRCGRRIGVATMLRCVKELGLRGRAHWSRWERLANTPLPAIAVMRDGKFILLAKFSGDTVLVQDPLQGRPTLLKRKD